MKTLCWWGAASVGKVEGKGGKQRELRHLDAEYFFFYRFGYF